MKKKWYIEKLGERLAEEMGGQVEITVSQGLLKIVLKGRTAPLKIAKEILERDKLEVWPLTWDYELWDEIDAPPSFSALKPVEVL